MKKLFTLLFLAITLAASSQDIYSISKPLKLQTVNPGSASDSVLVRGSDKVVKFVPRSEFGGSSATPTINEVISSGNATTGQLFFNHSNGRFNVSPYGWTSLDYTTFNTWSFSYNNGFEYRNSSLGYTAFLGFIPVCPPLTKSV